MVGLCWFDLFCLVWFGFLTQRLPVYSRLAQTHGDPPASASHVLELQVCVTAPS